MYELFENISLIYSAIMCVCSIIFPFTIEKDTLVWNGESEEEKTEKKECGWEKRLRNIILVLAAIVGIVGVVWLTFNKTYIWILFPVTILTFFDRLSETYMSMGIIRKTLHSNGTGLLSVKEQVSIITIALFVGILNMYGLPKKCLEIAEGLQNEVMSDALLLMMLLLFVTIYYFLIGAMLLIPLKVIIRLGKMLGKRISPEGVEAIAEKYRKRRHHVGNFEYLSIRFMAWGLKVKRRLFFVVPLVSIIMLLDILLVIISAFIKIFLSIEEHVLNGIIQLFLMARKFSKWIIGISDKRLLILTFRSALIFSLTSIVIVNRYMPIIKRYEAGTAVLEFCASAIVIPLVLSWIMEYRNKSTSRN